jgi:hypothetical protein
LPTVGALVGWEVGVAVGSFVGDRVGANVGNSVGRRVVGGNVGAPQPCFPQVLEEAHVLLSRKLR